jgi:hypothetical protein
VLTLWAPQAQSLWDESSPVEVRELPADLAELARVLGAGPLASLGSTVPQRDRLVPHESAAGARTWLPPRRRPRAGRPRSGLAAGERPARSPSRGSVVAARTASAAGSS